MVRAALVGWLWIVGAGCGDECVDGAEQICPCTGGGVGVKACRNGAFPSDCDCTGARVPPRGGGPDDLPGARCGDSFCDFDETPADCPIDCGAVCGDMTCAFVESTRSCPVDCPGSCGDGSCVAPERVDSCPADCSDPACNEVCEPSDSCASDCPPCAPVPGERVAVLSERGLELGPPAIVQADRGPHYVAWTQRATADTPWSIGVAELGAAGPPRIFEAEVHPSHPQIALSATVTELALAWTEPSGAVIVQAVDFGLTAGRRYTVDTGAIHAPAIEHRDGVVHQLVYANGSEMRVHEVDVDRDLSYRIATFPARSTSRPALSRIGRDTPGMVAWIEESPDVSTGWVHVVGIDIDGSFGTAVIVGTARAGSPLAVRGGGLGWRVVWWAGDEMLWREYTRDLRELASGRAPTPTPVDLTLAFSGDHIFRTVGAEIVGHYFEPRFRFARDAGAVLDREGRQRAPAASFTTVGHVLAFIDEDTSGAAIAWVDGVCAP